VQARLVARLVDLLDSAESLVQENLAGLVQSISASNNSGLSMVKTARGMLLHYVRIESDRIAEYLTVAPTEWNFHPQGALANGLIGLKENDAERLMRTANTFVLSLDPCVEYEIEISHA
jgi:Ni,Fe-hydrogenase I large subunit